MAKQCSSNLTHPPADCSAARSLGWGGFAGTAVGAHTSTKAAGLRSVQYIYIHIIYIYAYTNVYITSEVFQSAFVPKVISVLGTCPPIAYGNLLW